MICPLSDNFKSVVINAVKMLREVGWDREADIIYFLAALDYSEDEGNLRRMIKRYLLAMIKKHETTIGKK